MPPNACLQVRRANFFLTLKQEDHANGWPSIQCGIRFYDFECEKEIPLIVTCPSRVHSSITDRWFERWGGPLIERIGWLGFVLGGKKGGGGGGGLCCGGTLP